MSTPTWQSCHQQRARVTHPSGGSGSDHAQRRTEQAHPRFCHLAQCFTIYLAVLARHKPQRVPDLLAYIFSIPAAAKKYKWPTRAIYDQNCGQQAAANPDQLLTQVDPSSYSQCYVGMSKVTCLDHSSMVCLKDI